MRNRWTTGLLSGLLTVAVLPVSPVSAVSGEVIGYGQGTAVDRGSEYVEVVYLTTKIKRDMPTHVDVFCKTPSTALCETIHTVEKDRIGTYVRTVSNEEMEEIERGLRSSLGMGTLDGDMLKETSVNDAEPNNDMGLVSMQKEIQLTAERDMFKKLYEDLLSKVVGR